MNLRLIRGKAYKIWIGDRDKVVTNGEYTYRLLLSLGDFHLSYRRFRNDDL